MKYLSEIEAEFDGTVVAAEDVGKDAGISNVRHQAVADDEIVDAPADVLLTGLEAIGPPGILNLVRIEGAEGVLEAAGQKTAEGVALLVGEFVEVVDMAVVGHQAPAAIGLLLEKEYTRNAKLRNFNHQVVKRLIVGAIKAFFGVAVHG